MQLLVPTESNDSCSEYRLMVRREMLTACLCGILQTDATSACWTTGNPGSTLARCQGQATTLCAQAGHINGFSRVLMPSHGCTLALSQQTRLVSFRNTTCTCTPPWSAHIPHFIMLLFLHHNYFPSCKGWTELPLTHLKIVKLFCGKQETLSVRRRNRKPKSFSLPWHWIGSHWFSQFSTH